MEEKKDKALDNAIASTNLEGLDISPHVKEIIRKALEQGSGDTSFLYQLNRILEEQRHDEHQR